MPVCQAVAEIHLGRLPEAEAALQQAIQKDPNNVEAIANSIVLNVLSAKDTTELIKCVTLVRFIRSATNSVAGLSNTSLLNIDF